MVAKYTTALLCLAMMGVSFVHGQELTKEQRENLKYKVIIFTSDDKELQRLWYEDRMDEMKLKGKLREDYHKMVAYHALKMELLKQSRPKLDNEEIKSRLRQQVGLLNDDVRPFLNETQFEIHQKSWEAIIRAVILKEGLDTN
ncbi:hypothetical protein [Flagellimonas allohymeniacidonis]|uniref:Periplasmic heavy metal sensor n=1 Tax=Flagellimonas allohymeniacidonis TaxID=2517819 RepID=A0A4Q8QG43_9FLAO|nr:hypothetical protein [Allomuricauda hymeniacidonis]TAI47319.1 hypothetical protein EW142_11605 [Allomuricauda hymeniacidonis]